MSYTANQYNYATPLSSAPGLFNETSVVTDKKYFTLFDNKLDGSYSVISGDVGLWGSSLSDENGNLPEPYILTITNELTIHSFRMIFSEFCYPVSFTVDFMDESNLLYSLTEVNNTNAEYMAPLPTTLNVTSCVITITKISKANDVVRLYNVYNPNYIKRSEDLLINFSEEYEASQLRVLNLVDKLNVYTKDNCHITNIIDVASDTLKAKAFGDSELINVHSIMKQPFRAIYGKVYITYTDPMLDDETYVEAESEAYHSNKDQILDGEQTSGVPYFALYANDLTGNYRVSDINSQIGWVSKEIGDENGYFANPPSITVRFSARPIVALSISFDDMHDNIVEDFTVTLLKEDSSTEVFEFTGNDQSLVDVIVTSRMIILANDSVADVVAITVTVNKVSKPFSPAVIIDMPVSSTVLYKGYENESDLMSIDLLEELTYEDAIEALGGVSANEITVAIDNSDKNFFFNNARSAVASQLKRNRKIVPWLGVEVAEGIIEWYTLGTFWSYKWDVPVNGLTAKVVGFDTIGLLSTTEYLNHQTQINKSIGYLIEYILNDAKTSLNFIEYVIDESLYDIIIPYAWFEPTSHAAALRKLSLCYPLHIYCDRQGRICAAPQKLHLDYYYDTWSDSTNVIDKTYSSLYTTLPNVVSVEVKNPTILVDEELVKDETVFSAYAGHTITLNFNKPFVDNLSVTIDCDASVTYDYTVYSWGIMFTFEGSGQVRSIVCKGSCVDISNSSKITRRDNLSVRLNGAVTRDVSSDFIQTSDLANTIIGRIFSLTENDRYDATVTYRGDIALSINDPILLQDGIAPDNRYNIKRHQLSWNGSLTGSAELNT